MARSLVLHTKHLTSPICIPLAFVPQCSTLKSKKIGQLKNTRITWATFKSHVLLDLLISVDALEWTAKYIKYFQNVVFSHPFH